MGRSKEPLEVFVTRQGEADIVYWQRSGNLKIIERINTLIESARVTPATGIGKPEKLRFQHAETFSRRIDRTHRFIYRIEGKRLIILAARFHYADK